MQPEYTSSKSERDRLAELNGYGVLDTPPEISFDRITNLAAHYFNVPIALISLVDEERQWFKSCVGLAVRETDRDIAFCDHAIRTDQVMIVPDAAKDSRFSGNPLVTGEPGIRFYAGAPLRTEQGFSLGTLCVIDTRPREDFSEKDGRMLADFASLVVDELDLRRSREHLEQRVEQRTQELEESNRFLADEVLQRKRAEEKYRSIFENAVDGIFITTPQGRFLEANQALAAMYGFGSPEELVAGVEDIGSQLYLEPHRRQEFLEQVERDGEVHAFVSVIRRKDGRKIWISESARLVSNSRGEITQFEGVVEDVTAQKEAEMGLIKAREELEARVEARTAELREAAEENALLASVLNRLGSAVAIIDARAPGYPIIFVNPEFEKLSGHSAQELMQEGFDFMRGGKTEAETHGRMQAALDEGRSFSGKIHYYRKDGTSFLSEVDLHPVLGENGEATHFVRLQNDITEREATARRFREREEQLLTIIDSAPAVICLKDSSGRYLMINRHFENLFQIKRHEILGKTDFEIFPEDQARVFHEHDRQVLEKNESMIFEEVADHPDGPHTYVSIKSPVPAKDGSAVCVLATDITERKKIELALKESQARVSAILETALDCIISMDVEGRVLDFNPAAEEVFGYSREEALGQPLAELIIPSRLRKAHRRGMKHFIATGEGPVVGRRTEVPGMRKDGTEFPVELAVTRIPIEGPPIFTAYLRDISDRLEAEEALRAAKEQAEEANNAKSVFLSRMSHELRSPMNAVLGFSQLLAMDDLEKRQREQVDHIIAGGRHLLDLINEVLDLSRIEAGRLDLSIVPVETGKIIREAVSLMQPLAGDRQLEIDCAAGEKPDALADYQRLKQVLLNLLSNACKYTPADAIVRIRNRRDTLTGEIAIEVEDNGPGIAPEKQDRLFMPFERLDHEDSPIEGTGLGLSLSKRLMEAMKGGITLESQPGEGCHFILRLPQAA